MNRSPIPWLGTNGFTWNPVTGCTFGCDYCYARTIARRFTEATPAMIAEALEEFEGTAFNAELHNEMAPRVFPVGFLPTVYSHRMSEPSRARGASKVIFVSSMGDLFDAAFSDEVIAEVIRNIAVAKDHTFVLLTKQAERMQQFMSRCGDNERMGWVTHDGTPPAGGYEGTGRIVGYGEWPLPNLILGVTVTNQEDADTRVPLLLETPAAYRMVSVEPMLGPVDLSFINTTPPLNALAGVRALMKGETQTARIPSLDFVAIGAKTPGKPLHESPIDIGGMTLTNPRTADLRALLAQCAEARVPVNYKHGNDTPSVDGIPYDCTLAELVKS